VLGPEFQGGKQLSVGLWQRVALAGAFRDAPFIILDEPTAGLGGRYADLFTLRASAHLAPRSS
jgi:ATP-binding cassette subfamily B protein